MSAIQILNVISDNLELVVAIQQGLFSALSGLCAMVGWTKASKVLGTLTTLDLGRLVRYAQKVAAFRQALSGAAKGGLLVLLLVGCSGSPQTIPTVCPVVIPSSIAQALPSPSAAQQAVSKAETVVEQAKRVAADPKVGALLSLAGAALTATEPMCEAIPECLDGIAKAREVLSKADATAKTACDALSLVAPYVPPERVPPELVTAQELCK